MSQARPAILEIETPQEQAPARSRTQTLLIFFLTSLLLVILGHLFVQPRVANGPTVYLTIRGDTNQYILMAEDHLDQVPSPFRYRVLVPFLASQMPFSTLDNLRLITSISLFCFYFICLYTCHRLGLDFITSILGLLAVYTTTVHLYNYHNPYLTDGFGLAILAAAVLSLVLELGFMYFLVLLVGVLVRENTLFIAPAWLAMGQNLKAVLMIVGAVVVALAIRIVVGPGPGEMGLPDYIRTTADSVGHLQRPVTFLGDVYVTWHIRWLILVMGLILIRDFRTFLKLSFMTLLLVIGAFLASIIATDVERMFSILSPILVICCAVVLSELRQRSRWMFLVLAGLLLVQLFEIPNIFVEKLPLRKVVWVAGVLFMLYAIYTLRKPLIEQTRVKWRTFRAMLQRAENPEPSLTLLS